MRKGSREDLIGVISSLIHAQMNGRFTNGNPFGDPILQRGLKVLSEERGRESFMDGNDGYIPRVIESVSNESLMKAIAIFVMPLDSDCLYDDTNPFGGEVGTNNIMEFITKEAPNQYNTSILLDRTPAEIIKISIEIIERVNKVNIKTIALGYDEHQDADYNEAERASIVLEEHFKASGLTVDMSLIDEAIVDSVRGSIEKETDVELGI